MQILRTIETTCNTCLEFQLTQPKERIIHHDIPMMTMGCSWCGHVPAKQQKLSDVLLIMIANSQ